ncbi:UNVERIFIED_CONTAM: hypothetical protein Sradi_0483500 [Sesamum radiatum]|uniref:Uncharacterized protein n=1 Tax=Sesamum radiatum TaxID=300843 RepID=A0AAW2WCG8_SESRA
MVSSIKHSCLVQDGNRRLIPYPRPRLGDGRRKNRTRTDPRPKCSRHISPSHYVPWTVARRPPMVTSSQVTSSQVASSSNPRAGRVTNELARCELASSLARRSRASLLADRLRARQVASSQGASSSRPQAGPGRRVRAHWIASS